MQLIIRTQIIQIGARPLTSDSEHPVVQIGGSARLPGGGSNTFGDLQAAIIIAHVKWLPTGAVLGCHDDISRGDRARGPAATAHGWLTARCHIHGDLAGRGINRAVVAQLSWT